jgi:hypothetical protein
MEVGTGLKRAMLMGSQICWGSGAKHNLAPCQLTPFLPFPTCRYLFFQGLKEEVKPGHAENRMVPGILLRSPKISTIPQATICPVFLNQVMLLLKYHVVSSSSEQ